MNLFINSPGYYTNMYGVNDEVYSFCNYISRNIDVTSYTDCLDTIGIVPMIAPTSVLSDLKWKNRRYVSLTYRMADISLCANFENYYYGDAETKKQIILENILESMQVIKKKLGARFNYEMMERDIISLLK